MAGVLPRTVTIVDNEKLLAPGIERLREQGYEVTVLPDGLGSAKATDAAAGASVLLVGTTP